MRWVARLERFTGRIWYIPLIALLSAVDFLILIIPTDALLVSAVVFRPRRWISGAIWVGTGSAVGAWALAYALRTLDPEWASWLLSSTTSPESWTRVTQWIQSYGTIALGVLVAGPVPPQPIVAVAAAAKMPLSELFFSYWVGRNFRYLLIAWVATHAPSFLGNLKGVDKEIEKLREASGDE